MASPQRRATGCTLWCLFLVVCVASAVSAVGYLRLKRAMYRASVQRIEASGGLALLHYSHRTYEPADDSAAVPLPFVDLLLGRDFSRCPTIVRLHSPDISDEVLGEVASLRSLRALWIGRHCRITHARLCSVLQRLPELEVVDIDGHNNDDRVLQALERAGNLRHLFLDRSRVSDEGLASLEHMHSLVLLSIASPNITDEGLRYLVGHKQLKGLSLGDAAIRGPGLHHLKSLRQLETLRLENTSLGNEGMSHIGQMHHLVHIDVRNTEISDEGIKHLPGMPNLFSLDLSGTQVGDGAVDTFAQLETLRILHLADTRISAGGIEALRAVLSETRITGSDEWTTGDFMEAIDTALDEYYRRP